MNETDIHNATTEWLGEMAFGIFADLEYALSEDLETSDEPSLHLTDTVEMWANRLHSANILSVEDFDTAISIVSRARAMAYNDKPNRCFVCGTSSPWPEHVVIGPDRVVCPECESAKSNWEDPRLDDYGSPIK
jgi:hypothetical protein